MSTDQLLERFQSPHYTAVSLVGPAQWVWLCRTLLTVAAEPTPRLPGDERLECGVYVRESAQHRGSGYEQKKYSVCVDKIYESDIEIVD